MCRRQKTGDPDGRSPAIRVLHLVSTFAVKTDTKWLHRLVGALSRDRIESAIACVYGGGEMMQRFADLGTATFNLSARREFSPAALWRAYRLIRVFKPDIVHTHLLRADLYGGLAARLAKVPVVLTSAYAIGAYRREKVRRLDGLADQVCRLLATDALAVSHAVRSDLIKGLRWPADRVHTIHTGVAFADSPDPSARQRIRDEWKVPDSSPLVLTVARLSHEKGVDVLIQSAALVHREFPAVRFVVVGDGPMRDLLSTRLADADLNGVVRLAGFREDIDAVLCAADLFALPSLMEGMPNVILEALSARLPVVATAVGGTAEAIEHERSGLLVPPRDPEALAAAIIRALGDEPLRRRLAHEGCTRARERFSVDRVARRYELLYERLYRTRALGVRLSASERTKRDQVASA